MGINAFTRGMRSVNPDGKIKVVWVNAWFDPGKEADAAKTLIDQGADIITQHTDSTAPCRRPSSAAVHGFGQASDMIKLRAQGAAHLARSTIGTLLHRAREGGDGRQLEDRRRLGRASQPGMLQMAPYPQHAGRRGGRRKAAEDGIKSGKIIIFKGPIKDQDGALKVKDGEALTDGEIAGMNWLAEGVEGKLPS